MAASRKKGWTGQDIARIIRERQPLGNLFKIFFIVQRNKRRTCEATPIWLVGEPRGINPIQARNAP